MKMHTQRLPIPGGFSEAVPDQDLSSRPPAFALQRWEDSLKQLSLVVLLLSGD